MNELTLHKNWKYNLPMLVTDLVYWTSEEGIKVFKISPEMVEQIKRRLSIIIANVGKQEIKDICANDGFNLLDQWFEELHKIFPFNEKAKHE